MLELGISLQYKAWSTNSLLVAPCSTHTMVLLVWVVNWWLSASMPIRSRMWNENGPGTSPGEQPLWCYKPAFKGLLNSVVPTMGIGIHYASSHKVQLEETIGKLTAMKCVQGTKCSLKCCWQKLLRLSYQPPFSGWLYPIRKFHCKLNGHFITSAYKGIYWIAQS